MTVLQFVRGTTEANDAYMGPEGELTVDEERDELRLHDNFTPGGKRILNLTQLMENFMLLISEFGDVEFEPSGRGFLTRVAHRTYELRELKDSNAIAIDEPLGVGDDPKIRRNFSYPSMKLKHVVTTGSDEEYLVAAPAEWDDGDGCCMFIRFHLAPNPEPGAGFITLQFQPAAPEPTVAEPDPEEPDPFTPRTLRLSDNGLDLHTAIGADFDCLVLAAGASYKLIGMTRNTIGGSTGEGPGATPGGDQSAAMYKFGGYAFESVMTKEITLAVGEYKYFYAGANSSASNDTQLMFEAIPQFAAISDDDGFEFRAILHNKAGKLMKYELVKRNNDDMIPSPTGPNPDTLFTIASLEAVMDIPDGTFTVNIESPAAAAKIGISAAGTQG